MTLTPYGLTEAAIGSVFNGFFLALSLVDIAIDSHALSGGDAHGLLAAYYSFKHGERVVSSVIAASVLFLPVVLYLAVVEDVRGLWLRPRHLRRHAAGVVGLAFLLCLVALTAAVVRPAEAALAAGGSSRADAVAVWWLHAIVAAANAAQLPLPFIKAAGAAEGAAADAAADAAAAAAGGAASEAAEPTPAAAAAKPARRRRAPA